MFIEEHFSFCLPATEILRLMLGACKKTPEINSRYNLELAIEFDALFCDKTRETFTVFPGVNKLMRYDFSFVSTEIFYCLT